MAKKKIIEVEEEIANEEGSLSGRLGEFGSAVMQIAEEKGISKERVLEVVEAALAAAYKKDYGKKGQVIRVVFDEVAKEANFFLVKEVVDETTREFIEEGGVGCPLRHLLEPLPDAPLPGITIERLTSGCRRRTGAGRAFHARNTAEAHRPQGHRPCRQ